MDYDTSQLYRPMPATLLTGGGMQHQPAAS
jgi:hypothetical protein